MLHQKLFKIKNMIKKEKIQSIICCFETGNPKGNYGQVDIYNDGPHETKQITYGKACTTQFGHLPELLKNYVAANGKYAHDIEVRLPLKSKSWQDDLLVKTLKLSGDDPIMVECQDKLFDEKYWNPSQKWAEFNGFSSNLARLVIYDSFIHSGGILDFLRKRFSAATPKNGGSEKEWIAQYVNARHDWLSNHLNKVLQKTIYRTNDMKRAISVKDWNLDLTFVANGIKVP